MTDDNGYDGNYINGIIHLPDTGIGVIQSFLQWAFCARWIEYKIDDQKIS